MKKSVPLDVHQARRVRAGAAGVDVLDQDGAGGRAVALPQLGAVSAVVGREEDRADPRP